MNFKLNFCETAHTKETEEINTQLICHFSTKKLIVFSNGNAKIREYFTIKYTRRSNPSSIK